MSYLTRLSQQTGLAPASRPAPESQSPKSPPSGLLQTEEFVAPASPDPSQTVEPPTLPTNPSPRVAAPNSERSLPPLLASQSPPQEPAFLGFSPPAAPLRPNPNSSGQKSPAPQNSASEGWVETDRGITVQFPAPEAATDAFQPSVILPEVTVQSPKPAPGAASPSVAYLQTLQAARDWVSASPTESRPAETVPISALAQAVPTAPATIQVVNPTELAISPSNRLSLGPSSSPWDRAANSTPFPTSTAEPTTVISIGSIQVTVEGPSTPPAPAPVRRSPSPRSPARLSRHYLRLR